MMHERDRETLRMFAARVREFHPTARIWAFGSRTRGEAKSESDLDVCVVLDQVDANIRRQISDLAWEIGFDQDLVISTVVFSVEMFERGRCSASGLVQTVRQEGVAA